MKNILRLAPSLAIFGGAAVVSATYLTLPAFIGMFFGAALLVWTIEQYFYPRRWIRLERIVSHGQTPKPLMPASRPPREQLAA